VVALGLLLAFACGGGGPEGEETTPTIGASATAPAASVTPPSGDNEPAGKIAFISFRDVNREIYLINADGSGETNLTKDPGNDFNPDWSPDGSTIVFVSDRGDDVDLYTMDADGSDVRRLTTQGGGLSPRWSPDGSQIAFARGGDIWVMNADGSDERLVLADEPEETAAPCRAGMFPGGWSPDGSRISYYSASVSRAQGQACTVAVDGSDVQVVVDIPSVYSVEPAWSPDGKYLAFRSIRDGNHDIYIVDVKTKEEQRLTTDDATDVEPQWSPDGEWITFASSRFGTTTDIFIMRKDGSDVRRLNTDPAKDSEPVWAP